MGALVGGAAATSIWSNADLILKNSKIALVTGIRRHFPYCGLPTILENQQIYLGADCLASDCGDCFGNGLLPCRLAMYSARQAVLRKDNQTHWPPVVRIVSTALCLADLVHRSAAAWSCSRISGVSCQCGTLLAVRLIASCKVESVESAKGRSMRQERAGRGDGLRSRLCSWPNAPG